MAVRKFGSPLATCDVGHHRDAAQWWGIHATVGAHADEGGRGISFVDTRERIVGARVSLNGPVVSFVRTEKTRSCRIRLDG
jgi:hypothetical protein